MIATGISRGTPIPEQENALRLSIFKNAARINQPKRHVNWSIEVGSPTLLNALLADLDKPALPAETNRLTHHPGAAGDVVGRERAEASYHRHKYVVVAVDQDRVDVHAHSNYRPGRAAGRINLSAISADP